MGKQTAAKKKKKKARQRKLQKEKYLKTKTKKTSPAYMNQAMKQLFDMKSNLEDLDNRIRNIDPNDTSDTSIPKLAQDRDIDGPKKLDTDMRNYL